MPSCISCSRSAVLPCSTSGIERRRPVSGAAALVPAFPVPHRVVPSDPRAEARLQGPNGATHMGKAQAGQVQPLLHIILFLHHGPEHPSACRRLGARAA
jgi:hypothetical protein